jgi:hypothetical protein
VNTGFWQGDLRVRDHFEDLNMDWSIVLNWIFKKSGGGHGVD